MKKVKVFLTLIAFSLVTIFQSCEPIVDPVPDETNIVPEKFMIEIPSSLANNTNLKSANASDTLQGNDIYQHLTSFILVGVHASVVANQIMFSIALYNLSQPLSFSFTGDDDGRTKQVVIIENSTFEGIVWDYQMTITDDGPGNTSGMETRAMQVFWNLNPVEGIAILNPYNCDRTIDPEMIDAMYRIEYNESGSLGYDKHMIVTIDNLPLADPLANPYSISTLKMFVGKSGDEVSVYGNSEHPNALFFNGDVGFDWAFAASSYSSSNIAVAEVGLPSHTLNASDRYTLLEVNSIENVFTGQIYDVWPAIDSTSVQGFLHNTEAPGFFNQWGFVQGGTAPGPQYAGLQNTIQNLTPYNPSELNNLDVVFKP
ncbi:MAG: hypothetical protein U9R19_09235 [Bacteroidota bacterium]|nr:hypothetical protein [Bacteroidota bacterium]